MKFRITKPLMEATLKEVPPESQEDENAEEESEDTYSPNNTMRSQIDLYDAHKDEESTVVDDSSFDGSLKFKTPPAGRKKRTGTTKKKTADKTAAPAENTTETPKEEPANNEPAAEEAPTKTKKPVNHNMNIFSQKVIKSLGANVPKEEKEKLFSQWWEEQINDGVYRKEDESRIKRVFIDKPQELTSHLLRDGHYNKTALGSKGKMGTSWIPAAVRSFSRYSGGAGYNVETNPFLRYLRELPTKVFQSSELDAAACGYIEQLISAGKIQLDNPTQMKIFTDPRTFRYTNYQPVYNVLYEMSGEDGPRYWERSELHLGKDAKGNYGIFDRMLNTADANEALTFANNIRNPGNGRNRGKAISASDTEGQQKMLRKVKSALRILSDFSKMAERDQIDYLLKFVTDTDSDYELASEIVRNWRTRNSTAIKTGEEAQTKNTATTEEQQSGETLAGYTNRHGTQGKNRNENNNGNNGNE